MKIEAFALGDTVMVTVEPSECGPVESQYQHLGICIAGQPWHWRHVPGVEMRALADYLVQGLPK